jgi:hypothetical protein
VDGLFWVELSSTNGRRAAFDEVNAFIHVIYWGGRHYRFAGCARELWDGFLVDPRGNAQVELEQHDYDELDGDGRVVRHWPPPSIWPT